MSYKTGMQSRLFQVWLRSIPSIREVDHFNPGRKSGIHLTLMTNCFLPNCYVKYPECHSRRPHCSRIFKLILNYIWLEKTNAEIHELDKQLDTSNISSPDKFMHTNSGDYASAPACCFYSRKRSMDNFLKKNQNTCYLSNKYETI